MPANLTTETREALSALASVLIKLDDRDAGFARDLIMKGFKYGPSPKQMDWIVRLTQKANGEQKAEVPKVEIGSLAGVKEHFSKAKSKFPKLHFGDIQVYVATERSQFPGAIQVKKGDEWLGRIHTDGQFVQSRRVPELPAGLIDLLKQFADNPRETAAKYGRNTGRCCFCGHSLFGENETSQKLGYGPGCAKTWNLPWGVKAAREQEAA